MKLRLLIIFLLSLAVLAACKTDPKKLTTNYIDAVNQYDSVQINKSLAKNFRFINSPFSYGSRINIDSFKTVEGRVQLINSTTKGHTVQTAERWTSVYNSLLLIKEHLILHNTYQFNKNLIKSITINKAENLAQYKKQVENKIKEFVAYVSFEHSDLTEEEKQRQVVILLTEFSHLSPTDQKEYIIRAYLKNSVFVSNNLFGMGLMFTGKRTVLVNILGINLGTTYTIDEDLIQIDRIQNNYSMPLFIKDENTMIGKSFLGNCIFKRVR